MNKVVEDLLVEWKKMNIVTKEHFLYVLYHYGLKKKQWLKDELVIKLYYSLGKRLSIRSIEYRLWKMKKQGFVSITLSPFEINPFFPRSRKKIVTINLPKIKYYLQKVYSNGEKEEK